MKVSDLERIAHFTTGPGLVVTVHNVSKGNPGHTLCKLRIGDFHQGWVVTDEKADCGNCAKARRKMWAWRHPVRKGDER